MAAIFDGGQDWLTIFKVNHKIPSQTKLVSLVAEKTWMSFLAHINQGPYKVLLSVFINRCHVSFLFLSHKPLTQVGTKLIRNITRWFSTYYLIFISLENLMWLLGTIMLSCWLKFEKSSQNYLCDGIATIILLYVMKKFCIILERFKIQDGHHNLSLDNAFFFSRTAAYEVIRLVIDVPWGVLGKCRYFSEWFEIKNSHPVPSLAKTFFYLFSKTTSYKVTRHARFVPLREP